MSWSETSAADRLGCGFVDDAAGAAPAGLPAAGTTAVAAAALEFFGISAKPDYQSPEYKAYDAARKAAIKRLAPSAPSTTSFNL